ncbi:MAG TPA: dTMP kinase [Xanthobacteraceae bacterium]|jgi:dTMP kinase|nr:dTMP kinase [Xanthobacteraceae bacterium]
MHGRFITLEGGEGSGKSTQAERLAARLRALAISVVVTREPGGSAGADIMRHVLLSGAAKPLGPVAETLLFAAARDDHVRATIAPALAQGRWVVCDRFIDSTRVYQGTLGEVDPRLIRALERLTIASTMPELTFVLDLPPEIGLARAARRRAGARADRFETEAIEFHTRLRQAYRDIAAAEPQRCVLIDADRSADAVADDIWSVVNARLDPASAPLSLEDLGA